MELTNILFMVTLGLGLASAQNGHLSFNDGKYLVDWTLAEDKQSILFQVSVSDVVGWIGLGFSNENESMRNADIIVGEVAPDNTTLSVGDFWSLRTGRPTRDASQDLDGIQSSRGNGIAHMEFVKNLDTGDTEQDLIIPLDGIYLMWSKSDQEVLNGAGHTERGYSEEKIIFDPTSV